MLSRLSLCLVACLLLTAPALADDERYLFKPALTMADPLETGLLDIEQCGERLVAVGERGVIVLSDDGGSSWRQAEVPVSQLLTALACPTADALFAVGHGGVILRSRDGGESWTLMFDGDDANAQWLTFKRAELERLEQEVAAAGDEASDDLLFALEDARYFAEDAADAKEQGPVDPFLDVFFLDAKTGLAVGAYGMIYRTEDGGDSWQLAADGIANIDRFHYYALARAAGGDMYLAGEAGLLYRSRDDGRNWQRLSPGYDGSLFGVVPEPDGGVLAFGLRGNILGSDDGGESWARVAVRDDPRLSLYGGKRLGDGTIVLVGGSGVVLYRRHRDESFVPASMPERSTLSSVVGEQLQDALTVGLEGLAPLKEALP